MVEADSRAQDGPLKIAPFTTARATRPAWMRALNAAGRLAPTALRPSADRWWEAAQKAEPDAGDPRPEARAALAVLVESLNEESHLNLIGRFSARDDTLRLARNHLRIQKLLRDRPEILETPLPPPVFIVGLPRTGTTFLHQLLSKDDRNRTIPYWESYDPIPPTTGEDRRPAKVDKMLGQLESMAPNYHAIHPMSATSAEECVALFMNELRTLQFDIQYRAPTYARWLVHEDAKIAYEAYRRQLQIIQFYRPTGERFLLKDPTHTIHLEAVLEVFPDARILFTHRDPAASISSICSLYAYTRTIFSDEVDPAEIGQDVLNGYWAQALERSLAIRASMPAERYADVRQADLARDPLQTVATLYEKLGFDLHAGAESDFRAFLAKRSVSPRSVHEHPAAGFGLTDAGIRERFKEYIESFDLEPTPTTHPP